MLRLIKNKPIIIVPGEPNSIFLEIYFKSIKKYKFKSPIVLICSFDLLKLQMKKLKYDYKINIIKENEIKSNLKINKINLIDVSYKIKKPFEKITDKSNNYIKDCFDIALRLLKKKITYKFINGPISKKHFLKNKYLGITEYLAKKTKSKKFAMLIFNKKLSVSPITTHLPIKHVSNKISKKIITEKVKLINDFYINLLKFKPKFGITGLNPHCESIHPFNEDEKIVRPSVKFLNKKNINIKGPYAADTIFLKKNRKNYNIIIGMYHDQVLTPLKTLYEYDAINITLGLPFIRVSPDHGPNESMIGKNKSNYLSLFNSIKFLDF
jgi:4-hydroxythreonine-4-phosphate dehydrogenase